MSEANKLSKNDPPPNNTKSLPVDQVITGSISTNDTIYAGFNSEFAIITTQVSGTNKYSGKGTAYINWLKARVSVKFDSITVDINKNPNCPAP